MNGTASHIADNLRRLRAERGLIAAELCARSGVARATLSQIEAGRAGQHCVPYWSTEYARSPRQSSVSAAPGTPALLWLQVLAPVVVTPVGVA